MRYNRFLMPLNAGQRLGPYEILSPLGTGGMGEVYRARDSRLDRDVAVKVLPEHLARDPQSLSRFARETKAVAALSHPNILSIFDIGAEGEIHFAVTELLEGETLRGAIKEGPLSWRKAVEIAVAAAEGLAAAHSKGVIHRDLKPENIFVTTDGRVKLLDFGLARFRPAQAESDETQAQNETLAGTVMGTPGYMSPEQVRGTAVTPSSDIFSLGCVIYELISGKRAFQGTTAVETMSAVLRDRPAGVADSRKQIPADLDRLISHCLEKNPEERFQSARDLAYDLKSTLGTPVPSAVHAEPSKSIDSIAVLPFVNAGGEDAEYLSDGITESIINSLVQIAQLRVTPRSTVFRYRSKDVDPQSAGRELGVRAILSGRVMQRGETLVVATELVDVVAGAQLWGERYNRKIDDIFALEEEIARKISESLRMRLSGEENKKLAKRFTENSEAYQLYLRGRHHWLRRSPASMKRAMEYFQQAIEKDPAYALAYAGVADCHSLLSVYCAINPKEGWARAKAASAAAIALDPELAEGHVSAVFIKAFADWDWAGAEQEALRAIELNPALWQAPYWYACVLSICGRNEEAEKQIQRARDLEPLSATVMHIAALVAFGGRRYSEAAERSLRGLDLDPQHPLLRLWLGTALVHQGMYEDAIRELEKAYEYSERETFAAGALGHAYAVAGNEVEARRILGEILETSARRPVDMYGIALIHVGLGERELALEWLEKSFAARLGFGTLMVRMDGRVDDLRPDPRFRAILQRMGLE